MPYKDPEQRRVSQRLRTRRYRERHPERVKESAAQWQRKHPEWYDAYRQTNPERYRANYALNNAVRAGKIVKPSACEECGQERLLHGHHDDYAKPLEVRWLCPGCHGLTRTRQS